MSENLRKFNVLVDGEYFAVEVEDTAGGPTISSVQQSAPRPAPAASKTAPAQTKPAAAKSTPATIDDEGGTPLIAPMPGMIVGLDKKEGDQVNEGETILVLEAMKMENGLPSPVTGTIKKINLGVGDHVAKNDILCVIVP
jgi:biotin carboxyl carrier protein